jgi:hypothetical protein
MEGVSQESHPSLLELPEELLPIGRLLVKALSEETGVAQAFADFCGKAYVKRDWAGGASEFLVTLFENHQDLLAEMARIPDLIIELGSGHLSLTCMVAYRWAAQSDTTRLSKLAEALGATQSKMSDPEIVHIMLALVTSLAITRYSRAEQMLSVAEPKAAEEHQESLQEARLWLAAGRIVCSCSQESRDLWDHRLRRKRTAWTWDKPAEQTALAELEEHLTPDQDGSSLFQEVTPAIWWSLANQRITDRIECPVEPAPSPQTPRQSSLEPRSQPQAPQEPVIIVWNAWPFFAGGLVGAAALALMIWITPYELTRPAPAKPVPIAVKAETPTQVASADELWRHEEASKMASEATDLKPHFDKVHSGTWTEHELLLSGNSLDLPTADPRYTKLLTWLHLDPPMDEDIRSHLPSLLATAQANSDTLALWVKLFHEGSPMKSSIQSAARRQLHDNKEAWSASQEQDLSRLAW